MTRGHLVLEHAIDQISVGFSFRRDVEEGLDELCESIERFGVIHPPVVTEQYSLISGRRVLAAQKRLGYRVTPIWIVHGVSDKLSQILAIRDEETLRKALKPIEQAELYEELKKLYAEAGLDGSKETIAYCRIGERSSHTWFVLQELLGHENVKNYDGSWTEYGSLVGAPIELGS